MHSIGCKDHHGKVCIAKGPRDHRIHLSMHTAIQVYNVQDHLGYNHPSKAIDWLIKNAKATIDELGVLPAWHPSSIFATSTSNPPPASDPQETQATVAANQLVGDSGKELIPVAEPITSATSSFGSGSDSASFLPPSLDSDAIADTIKSFLPMGAVVVATVTTTVPPSSPPISF